MTADRSETAEISAWRFLAQFRADDSGVSFVSFFDDGDDKVMSVRLKGDFSQVARCASFGECAIELSEALQCDGLHASIERWQDGSNGDATSAEDGGPYLVCVKHGDASTGEQASAAPATPNESGATDA
jgi:hypothetical protein